MPEERNIIKSVLHQYIPNARFYIFGSRAKDSAQRYSDLDVIIASDEPIALHTLALLADAFSESDLPFMVDLIDWQRISNEFQEHVQREWVVLD